MAMSRVGKKVAFLEEWIDGATIQKSSSALGDDPCDGAATGFAWNLFDHVLRLFSIITPLASNGATAISKKGTRSLKESLGKLFLWGDSFRDGRLEIVLDASDEIKESVLSTLATVGRILIQG